MADNLFGKLSRALQNPVLQSVATGVAAGPLFGLLSLPAFKTEQRIAENDRLTNEAARLSNEDLRLSIMSKRNQMGALDRLPGLMRPDTVPNPLVENFGAPGEDVPGFSLANPQRLIERESDLVSTLTQLAGPQGANTLLQNRFPQARTNPFAQKLATTEAALQANDPNAKLTNEQIINMAGGHTPIELQQALLDANMSMARIKQIQTDLENERRERAENRGEQSVRFGAMLRDGQELFETLDALKGSVLEPGGVVASTFGPSAASAGASFFDITGNQALSSDWEIDQENFNRFEKASSRFVGALATQLANAGVAQNSQTIANVRAASPNRDITIRANLAAMKAALVEAQEVLTAKGISVPDEYFEFIDQLEGLTPVRRRGGGDTNPLTGAQETVTSAFDVLGSAAESAGKTTTEVLRDLKDRGTAALNELNMSLPDQQAVTQWLQGVQEDAMAGLGQAQDAVGRGVDAAPGVAQDFVAGAQDLAGQAGDAANQGIAEVLAQTRKLTAPRFQSQDTADQAFRSGEIEDGDPVWIRGQFGTYEADFTDQAFRQANQFSRRIGEGLGDIFGEDLFR